MLLFIGSVGVLLRVLILTIQRKTSTLFFYYELHFRNSVIYKIIAYRYIDDRIYILDFYSVC